jgi:hypothetical protein
MDKSKEFLEKLRLLLEEYNAEITCEIDGDTHGVSTAMQILMDNKIIFEDEFDNISAYTLKQ